MQEKFVKTLMLTLLTMGSAAFAQSLDFTLYPGFYPDPHRVTYISGGTVDASNFVDVYGYRCEGWIASSPDHVMRLTSPFGYLRMFAESSADLTMVLFNTRTGEVFCDDDGHGGLQPEIEMSYITADEWWIYVGSYYWNERHPYTLTVTEFSTDLAYGW